MGKSKSHPCRHPEKAIRVKELETVILTYCHKCGEELTEVFKVGEPVKVDVDEPEVLDVQL